MKLKFRKFIQIQSFFLTSRIKANKLRIFLYFAKLENSALLGLTVVLALLVINENFPKRLLFEHVLIQ